ncbi:MAG: phospholipase, partial [Bacteroidota bacterium]
MYRNVLIFSLLISGFLFAQNPGIEEIYEQRLYQNSDQDTLLYRWLAPAELAEGERYPLVLFLHGSGERGNDNTAQLVHVMPRFSAPERRSKYPAYVFAPQCPREDFWSNGAFSDNGQAYRLNENMNPSLRLSMEALTYMISIY